MNVGIITKRLDRIASSLESQGYPDLAEEIDVISNTIEKLAKYDPENDSGIKLYKLYLNQLKDKDNWTLPMLLQIKEQFTSRISPSLERHRKYTYAGTGPSEAIKKGLGFYNQAIRELKKAEDGSMPNLQGAIKNLEAALGAFSDDNVVAYMNKYPEGDQALAEKQKQEQKPSVQTYYKAPQAPKKKGLLSLGRR